MKTSGPTDVFIRQAVEQGIRAFAEKVKRSRLDEDAPRIPTLVPEGRMEEGH